MKTTTFGSLVCRVVLPAADAAPSVVVFLCHGFGAPGSDLVSLAAEMRHRQPALSSAMFVFPEGPLALDGGGGARAWWNIDMMRLHGLMRQNNVDAMFEEPDGLSSARKKFQSCVDAVLTQTKLSMRSVIVGGFSQGAMLTTDWTLRSDEPPKALAILSGTLLTSSAWALHAKKRTGLRVVQSHGRSDPVLPFSRAEKLHTLLADAGCAVRWVPFDGGHGISEDVVDALAALCVA
jgi:phospholipase/carboxylesterase